MVVCIFLFGFIAGILTVVIIAYVVLLNGFGKPTPLPPFINQFQPLKISAVSSFLLFYIFICCYFRSWEIFCVPTQMARALNGNIATRSVFYFISFFKSTKTLENFAGNLRCLFYWLNTLCLGGFIRNFNWSSTI